MNSEAWQEQAEGGKQGDKAAIIRLQEPQDMEYELCVCVCTCVYLCAQYSCLCVCFENVWCSMKRHCLFMDARMCVKVQLWMFREQMRWILFPQCRSSQKQAKEKRETLAYSMSCMTPKNVPICIFLLVCITSCPYLGREPWRKGWSILNLRQPCFISTSRSFAIILGIYEAANAGSVVRYAIHVSEINETFIQLIHGSQWLSLVGISSYTPWKLYR